MVSFLQVLHELICHADTDVKTSQLSLFCFADEVVMSGWSIQNTHLCASSMAAR